MANFLYQTKDNSNPKGKPRVYFTCHPDDFEAFFGKICADIFQTQDCTVFYMEDLTEEIEEKYLESDLGQMNLFVIPVTFRLLTTPNHAMDRDFAYAKANHIPVLPIMMELGLDSIYSRADKFGELQYLNPCAQDLTAITYADKLKKHLESVLIQSDTAERIRAAFDAYIFLSYRKKDRHYANELMKLIHADSEFRDVAIWYDEFLTPGESFRESIGKMMRESKLFTLLVTPNLLEEPNFVMTEEYPFARAKGMTVIPAEMVKTNHFRLKRKYKGLKGFVDPYDTELLSIRLRNALQGLKSYQHDNSPEHRYLMGLAYLDGIDVEMNPERGIRLITSAAESYHLDAMLKLFWMYLQGIRVRIDYGQAAFWAERIVKYCKEEYGAANHKTLLAISLLASTYDNLGDYPRALRLEEMGYELQRKTLGEEHPTTLLSMSIIESLYIRLGNLEKALELEERAYELQRKALGEEHHATLLTVCNLASTYHQLGNREKALEMREKAYQMRCKLQGSEHPETLSALAHLAIERGDHQTASETLQKVYERQCEKSGSEHPETLRTLNNLAYTLAEIGNYPKALEMLGRAYELRRKLMGERHPDTLNSLKSLACTYGMLGDLPKAVELMERAYALRCETIGEEHPETLNTLLQLTQMYEDLGDTKRAEELRKKSNLPPKP